MKNETIRLAIAIVIAGVFSGCPGSAHPAAGVNQPVETPWISLFNGRDLNAWKVVQGTAQVREGSIVLDGRNGDVTILASSVDLQDGIVEVHALRRPQPQEDPYTVSVRLTMKINWSAIYFVCRPQQLEVCRGSAWHRFPAPESIEPIERSGQAEVWRFVLKGGTIDCYRGGKKITSYQDASPQSGTIALTASKCQLEISQVRYKPASPAGGGLTDF